MQTSQAVLLVLALALASCHSRAPFSSPIATDRPGFHFASSVVPRGAAQVELGTPTWSKTGSDRATTWIAQGRFGVLDSLELRFAATPYATLESDSGDERGTGDLEVGFKWAFASSPATALIGTTRIPTGEAPFSSEDPGYALHAIAETSLDERHALKGMLGFLRTPDGSGGELDSAMLGVLLSRSIASSFGAYVEAVAQPALESGPDPCYAGAGLAWLCTHDSQFDLAFDRGLGDDASDWIWMLGFSQRW